MVMGVMMMTDENNFNPSLPPSLPYSYIPLLFEKGLELEEQ